MKKLTTVERRVRALLRHSLRTLANPLPTAQLMSAALAAREEGPPVVLAGELKRSALGLVGGGNRMR